MVKQSRLRSQRHRSTDYLALDTVPSANLVGLRTRFEVGGGSTTATGSATFLVLVALRARFAAGGTPTVEFTATSLT